MIIPLIMLTALSMGMITVEPESFLRAGWSIVLFVVGYSLGVLSEDSEEEE